MTPACPTDPAFVAVVVPAHDEEARIAACLGSLQQARRHERLRAVPTAVVVVLDHCSDRTGDIAQGLLRGGDRIVRVDRANVGAARRAGLAAALGEAAGLAPSEVWLATTDADSRVGPDWLARQLAWRRRGLDAVAGTVRVDDWSEHSGRVRRRYHRHVSAMGAGTEHPHVHGANLSFSAAAYRRVGGIPPLGTGEDRALWEVLRASGARTVGARDLSVVTSGRADGRAGQGFSSLLRRLDGDHPGATRW